MRPHSLARAGQMFRTILIIFVGMVTTFLEAAEANHPPRLKRSEAFLGIHFDFHAGPDCTEIGKNTTREMIENILTKVRPDYLQIDCKGHPGLSSYPTRVGNQAPGFVGDPLKLWRQVTAERGVSLYMHYSGIWDSEAVRKHPEWAAVTASGKPDVNAASPFGPYVDKLLIPQLRELAGEYGIDGVWVDGECWATIPDYGETATREFMKQTGFTTIPKKSGEPHWNEWIDFHREAFRKYLRHYITEVKRTNPRFEICSNWAFSDHMPEPVTAALDFLSGDFSPQNSLNSARFSARCLANQGRPWDLMAWAFSAPQSHPVRPLKSEIQLQQEAAVVLAQGGGFQAYFSQNRDGSIKDWQMDVMAGVARFCRDRQSLAHRQQIVPQIALLYSRAAHYRNQSRLFAPWGSAGIQGLRGTLQSLLDSQMPVQIVSEHHLQGRMNDWPLIIIPEWDWLEPAFQSELESYVKSGGSLLLIGSKSMKLFKAQLGGEWIGEAAQQSRFLALNGRLAGIHTPVQNFVPAGGSKVIGRLHHRDDPRSESEAAASWVAVGRGKIGALHFNYGDRYLNGRTAIARELLAAVVDDLFPNRIVKVTGSRSIDVSLGRNQGRLLVNLVNTAGPHELEKEYTFDNIPAAGPLEVQLSLARKPKSMRLEPGGKPVEFQWKNGVAKARVPRVEIYDILSVTE